jgi:anti-sigma factor RsiW
LPKSDDDRLHWLAALYVSQEISPEEAAEFEELLASDPAAQDALCNWVEITQAVRVIEESLTASSGDSVSTHQPRSSRRLRTWMAAGLGALAAAALIGLGQWIWFGGAATLAIRSQDDGNGSTMAAANWPEGFTLTQVVSLSHAASHGDGELDAMDGESTLTDADATSLDVPTWMLAAVKLPEPEATP